ncbi:MAG: CrcB family protein [Kiritimatiellae bacterium]|nr:CrcB family protein [Kiritimatiellia bacterium]
MKACLLVGAGGFAGSILRYLTAIFLYRSEQIFSLGTLAANMLGCFLIGMITQAVGQVSWMSAEVRLLLATGLCGGFTTMSSLILESHHLFKNGNIGGAGLYLVGTLALSMTAFIGGMALVSLITR